MEVDEGCMTQMKSTYRFLERRTQETRETVDPVGLGDREGRKRTVGDLKTTKEGCWSPSLTVK